MIELKEYDNGFSDYISKLEIKKMPLLSWDFYGDFLSQLNKTISDQNQLTLLANLNAWKLNAEIKRELNSNAVVVVTCPHLKIVFASKNMVRMNGYQPEEVIGFSPKMFQGEKTCLKTSQEISQAVKNKQPFEKTITNYCKNGSLYKCHIKGFPVFNVKGKLINFIAFEKVA